MEDVTMKPETEMVTGLPTTTAAITSEAHKPTQIPVKSLSELDGWISVLMECKQLSELDVKRLCEAVGSSLEGYMV